MNKVGQQEVYAFLKENNKRAYTCKDISESTGGALNAVRISMMHLLHFGFVEIAYKRKCKTQNIKVNYYRVKKNEKDKRE